MMKFILIICVLFLASLTFAQKNVFKLKKASFDKLPGTMVVARSDGMSAIYDASTKKLLTEPDSSFYHYYASGNCLIRVFPNDSIHCYTIHNGLERTPIRGKKKLSIVIESRGIIHHGGHTVATMDSTVSIVNQDMGTNMNVTNPGIFGVEIVDDEIFVQDYQKRQSRMELDANNNPVLVTDSVTGITRIVQKEMGKGYCRGGMKRRFSAGWIVEPEYIWVVKTFDGYAAESLLFKEETGKEMDSSFYIFYGKTGAKTDSIGYMQLFQHPELYPKFVPKYKCDSIFSTNRGRDKKVKWLADNYDYHFLHEKKVGVFVFGSNKIFIEPVDYMSHMGSYTFVQAIVDHDSIFFRMYGNSLKYPLEEGYHFEHYSLNRLKTNKHDVHLRIRSDKSDSVMVFFYSPRSSNIRDSLKIMPFEGSDLQAVLDPNGRSSKYVVNELQHYGFAHGGGTRMIVNDSKRAFFDAPPQLFSGVLDLSLHEWIVPQQYSYIEKVATGFKAYLSNPWRKDATYILFDPEGNQITE